MPGVVSFYETGVATLSRKLCYARGLVRELALGY